MRRAATLLAPVLALASGCGSTPAAQLPPPAEPAPSPPLAAPPAGRVLPGASDRAGVAGHAASVSGRRLRSDRARGRLVVDGRPVRVPGLLAPDGVTPAGGGRAAVVDARARRVVLVDVRTLRVVATAPAGVGPTHVAWDGRRRLYVVDTAGGALLVFELRGRRVDPVRYVHLPGSPYAIAIDPDAAYRVWVTLTARNELVGLPAHGRPRVVERLPTVRAPRAVSADRVTGRVTVVGTRATQVVDPAA